MGSPNHPLVCVCVCVWEREREREKESVSLTPPYWNLRHTYTTHYGPLGILKLCMLELPCDAIRKYGSTKKRLLEALRLKLKVQDIENVWIGKNRIANINIPPPMLALVIW